jgi:uncharacterized membrane protein YphA (DoxX/SURF4 family)
VGVLLFLRSDGQYILASDTIIAVFLSIIILCDVLIRQGAVFLLIIMLMYVLIDSGRSFLLKVRWTTYFS